MDWGGPISDSDRNQVILPEVNRPTITEDELQNLQETYTLDRIIASEYHAVDLYVELVHRVSALC